MSITSPFIIDILFWYAISQLALLLLLLLAQTFLLVNDRFGCCDVFLGTGGGDEAGDCQESGAADGTAEQHGGANNLFRYNIELAAVYVPLLLENDAPCWQIVRFGLA